MPNTRNGKKMTIVIDMKQLMDKMINQPDPLEEEPDLPSPVKPKAKTKAPPKRRGRVRRMGLFDGSLSTIADFIALIDQGILYSNIDVPRISVIREELIQLNDLIGLDGIKKTIVEQLVFYLQGLHEGGEMYMNTVIYGPPGTGKTTVAKLMGIIFSKLDILRRDEELGLDEDDYVFECARRDDLVGEYLGSTCTKTQQYLEMCRGGVMFLDEVYSLGNKEGGDSFAKEAIDTINLFLSEHRDEFMMIVAGYKDEVEQCFFKYNEGLRRRFMWYHTIDPYTPEQLRDIFLSKIKKNEWHYDETVPDAMLEAIKNQADLFGDNAGSIENFITLTKIKHSMRVLLLPHDKKRILNELDIKAAIKELQKSGKKKETFLSMYM